jgi:hypothetical protein
MTMGIAFQVPLRPTAAGNSLKALREVDFLEVHAVKRPPLGVHFFFTEAICIVKDVKPIKINCVKNNFSVL